jgi:PAS domain S-box-containing protein
MRKRNSIVKKLSLVVIAIVTLVIVATGVVNNAIGNHYALESARAVLKFNSESILSGIEKLMMSRNNDGVLELIGDISKGSRIYQDIRFVSHYSGEIVVSRLAEGRAILTEEDDSCAICHDQAEPALASDVPLDEVVARPDGTRILHVITPIVKQAGCETRDCHSDSDDGAILGFLQTEYSLAKIDSLIFGLNASFVVAAFTSILLGTTALWIMFKQTLGKPIRSMLGGIQALAGSDLSFRFKTARSDEFGLVEESFDHMAARIQAHQTELRDAREYLEGIVENSADIIITVNPKGLIQTVNRGAEQVLGYQREELIGQRIELLFADPGDRDAAIAQLDVQDNVTNYETRFLTKNRAVRHVLLTLSRLRDRDGAIKNMLNTLTGGSYLVRRGMAKNDQQRIDEGIDMIDEGISTIGNLSLNMLKYAKKWTLELELTDLGLLAKDICKAIKQTASDEGVTVRCNIPHDLPLVSCDPRLVHMALMDIATNALDACFLKPYKDTEAPEVALSLRVEKDENLILIAVSDNGIGMTEETKRSIFKPFFSTKEEWGTGLGLAVTSRIVKLVESEPDVGSEFRIALPVDGPNANQGAKYG